LTLETVNDTARPQEEETLEKGMGHQVKHPGGKGTYPHRGKHVAQLADG
ncbi:unnamed protein product, partial [marine sediment metagenome]